MRKLLAVLLVSVMIFGLAACGTQNEQVRTVTNLMLKL